MHLVVIGPADCIADVNGVDRLDVADHVADLAGGQRFAWFSLRRKVTHLDRVVVRSGTHEPYFVALFSSVRS